MPTDDDKEFIKRLDEAIIERAKASAIPLYLYAAEHEHGRSLGTGALVRIADTFLLVTAAHVLREANRSAPDPLITADLWHSMDPIRIGGSTAVGVADDLDVGILALSPKTVKSLGNFHFLGLDDIDYAAMVAPQGIHYVHGYPMVWTKPHAKPLFVSKTFTHQTTIIETPPPGLGRYDPKTHLLVHIDDDGRTLDGSPAELPAVYQGISGSAIWRAHRADRPPSQWTPSDIRCVAVQTGVYSQIGRTLVKATRWVYVASLIRRSFPDLIRVFDLHDTLGHGGLW